LEEVVFPDVMATIWQIGIMAAGGTEAPKGFMDTLPDPMKLDATALLFVMALVTCLFLFLKRAFFKPIVQVMDDREAAIQSGAARRAEAAALVEARQAEYAARLRDLRAQAFEHRKSLAVAAGKEKQALLERARQESGERRSAALAELRTAQEAARTELLAQVETLSESMVQHLLRQA
jgi:F-type H+-transporting ATPase subunit b